MAWMAWLGGPRAGKGAAHKLALCRVAAVVGDASIAGNAIGSGVEPSRSGGASSAMHSGHFSVGVVRLVNPWSLCSSPSSSSWYMPLLLQTMM